MMTISVTKNSATWTNDVDDEAFVDRVRAIIAGAVIRYQSEKVLVFRINNWFDSKWFQFAGKTLGALGVWDRSRVIVPPFVPNRVTISRSYDRAMADGTYHYAGGDVQIHRRQTSGDNLNNRLKIAAPNAAVFWYSGRSKANNRGSLMGY